MNNIMLLCILCMAVFFDFRYRKIPNLLIVIGILISITQWILHDPMRLINNQIPLIIIPIICLYFFFKIGAMGAGDIKLYCLLCFYLSLEQFLKVFFISFLISAIFSLAKMLYLGNIFNRFCYFMTYLSTCISNKKVIPYYQNNNNKFMSTITLSLPVLISTILVIGRNMYELYYGHLWSRRKLCYTIY